MEDNTFNQAPQYTDMDKKETKLHGEPKKFNKGAAAGIAAGAAVLGVGGTAAAMHFTNNDEEPIEDLDAQEEEIVIGDENFNPDAPIGSFFSSFTSTTVSSTPANHAQTNVPGHTQSAHTSSHQPQHNVSQQLNTQQTHVATGETGEIPAIDDIAPINPDQVLAETAVDVNDNDIPELLSFDNVELVPDDQGNVQIQAEFSMQGENYTMIDVDNDGVFDSVADASGADMGSAGGMMLSDIELINNANNNDYLAATDTDNNSDLSGSGESSINDMIEV